MPEEGCFPVKVRQNTPSEYIIVQMTASYLLMTAAELRASITSYESADFSHQRLLPDWQTACSLPALSLCANVQQRGSICVNYYYSNFPFKFFMVFDSHLLLISCITISKWKIGTCTVGNIDHFWLILKSRFYSNLGSKKLIFWYFGAFLVIFQILAPNFPHIFKFSRPLDAKI